MQRRSFLGAILGAAAAPAIVRASSLMPIKAPGWVGVDWGTDEHTGLILKRKPGVWVGREPRAGYVVFVGMGTSKPQRFIGTGQGWLPWPSGTPLPGMSPAYYEALKRHG